MSNQNPAGDPLAFVRNMWGNMGFSLPGMVTPTVDVEEIDKRINDLKAVEGWLRMNLSMLQMTIQSMEMQRTTLSAVQTMSQMVAKPDGSADGDAANALSQAAMWPWNMMQQMQAQMQEAAARMPAAEAAASSAVEQAQKASSSHRRGRKPGQ